MAKRYLNMLEEVIKALKEGKIIKTTKTKRALKMVDGVIVQLEENGFVLSIGSGLIMEDKPYIEEPEPLKLEVGKFYKTRRGDKVVCLCQRGDYYIHRLNSYIVGYWVDKTGRALFNGVPEMTETDSDVVALWEEINDK